MPPKLQVDESFAFLFTCIEASGCKIDFKLVGDATDLQPAAARMRYTRLRKAVEAGHFKGATLAQPTVVSASLSHLANPQSRRVGNAPHYIGQQKTPPAPARTTPRATPRNRTVQPINLDEEEEEEEDEEEYVELEGPLDQHSGKKRQVLNTIETEPEDHHLFFPDTSQSSRSQKKVKRSDSDMDEDDDEDEEYVPNAFKHSTRTLTQQLNTATPGQARVNPQQVVQQDGPVLKYAIQGQSALPVAASSHIGFTATEYPDHQNVSRRKQSANTAAAAAYEIGVKTGRFAPHPDDQNARNDHITPSYPVTDTHQLRYVGQGVHTQSRMPTPNNASVDNNMRRHIGPNFQETSMPFYNPQVQHPGGLGPFQQYLPGAFGTGPVPPPTGYQNPYQASDEAVTSPTEDYPAPRHYNPSDPNRFHPASVFDGFRVPTVPTYTPSTVIGTDSKRTGEPSLLQKLKMDKQKAAEDEAAEKEKQDRIAIEPSPQIKQRGRSGQSGAGNEMTDNVTGGVSARETDSNNNSQANVRSSNSQSRDRAYTLSRSTPRGSSTSTHTITADEAASANIRAEEVTDGQSQESDQKDSRPGEI